MHKLNAIGRWALVGLLYDIANPGSCRKGSPQLRKNGAAQIVLLREKGHTADKELATHPPPKSEYSR